MRRGVLLLVLAFVAVFSAGAAAAFSEFYSVPVNGSVVGVADWYLVLLDSGRVKAVSLCSPISGWSLVVPGLSGPIKGHVSGGVIVLAGGNGAVAVASNGSVLAAVGLPGPAEGAAWLDGVLLAWSRGLAAAVLPNGSRLYAEPSAPPVAGDFPGYRLDSYWVASAGIYNGSVKVLVAARIVNESGGATVVVYDGPELLGELVAVDPWSPLVVLYRRGGSYYVYDNGSIVELPGAGYTGPVEKLGWRIYRVGGVVYAAGATLPLPRSARVLSAEPGGVLAAVGTTVYRVSPSGDIAPVLEASTPVEALAELGRGVVAVAGGGRLAYYARDTVVVEAGFVNRLGAPVPASWKAYVSLGCPAYSVEGRGTGASLVVPAGADVSFTATGPFGVSGSARATASEPLHLVVELSGPSRGGGVSAYSWRPPLDVFAAERIEEDVRSVPHVELPAASAAAASDRFLALLSGGRLLVYSLPVPQLACSWTPPGPVSGVVLRGSRVVVWGPGGAYAVDPAGCTVEVSLPLSSAGADYDPATGTLVAWGSRWAAAVSRWAPGSVHEWRLDNVSAAFTVEGRVAAVVWRDGWAVLVPLAPGRSPGQGVPVLPAPGPGSVRAARSGPYIAVSNGTATAVMVPGGSVWVLPGELVDLEYLGERSGPGATDAAVVAVHVSGARARVYLVSPAGARPLCEPEGAPLLFSVTPLYTAEATETPGPALVLRDYTGAPRVTLFLPAPASLVAASTTAAAVVTGGHTIVVPDPLDLGAYRAVILFENISANVTLEGFNYTVTGAGSATLLLPGPGVYTVRVEAPYMAPARVEVEVSPEKPLAKTAVSPEPRLYPLHVTVVEAGTGEPPEATPVIVVAGDSVAGSVRREAVGASADFMLPAGRYLVEARAPGYAAATAEAAVPGTGSVELMLERTSVLLAVRVLKHDGSPAAGAEVVVEAPNLLPQPLRLQANSSGVAIAELPLPPKGKVEVTARSGGAENSTTITPETPPIVELTLRLRPPTGRLRVAVEGPQAQQAMVTVYNASGALVATKPGPLAVFELPPGAYRVVAAAPGGARAEAHASVSAGAETAVKLPLATKKDRGTLPEWLGEKTELIAAIGAAAAAAALLLVAARRRRAEKVSV